MIVSGRLGQGAHRKDSPQPHVSPHAPSAHAAHAPSFSHAHSYYNEEAGRRASDVSLAEVFVSDGWGCSFASVEQVRCSEAGREGGRERGLERSK